jgi:hypothetical protein
MIALKTRRVKLERMAYFERPRAIRKQELSDGREEHSAIHNSGDWSWSHCVASMTLVAYVTLHYVCVEVRMQGI